MKKRIKRVCALVLIAAAFVTLFTGCFTRSADELYSLPQLSDEYIQLQEMLDLIVNSGAEYAAPSSGSNRQAVQLQDIDRDGEDEVLAFFNFRSEEKPLRIYIFKQRDGEYVEALRLEGDGTSIAGITYADMDGDGLPEIIVGWKGAAGMNILEVFSVLDYQATSLLKTDYSEYTVYSLSRSGGRDLVIMRLGAAETNGQMELISISADGEITSSKANLSSIVESVSRIRAGVLNDGNPAVFVESYTVLGGYVTDVFVYRKQSLQNVTMNPATGVSDDTVRTYEVYSRDINSNGVVDVPRPVALPTSMETANYWLLEWYSYDVYGRETLVMNTYHNFSDEWYLEIPEEWRGEFTVRRENSVSGERAIIFSLVDENGDVLEDFLAIYKLYGDNKEERAKLGSRFTLGHGGDSIYAAQVLLASEALPFVVNAELVTQNFGIIYSEWITGEI